MKKAVIIDFDFAALDGAQILFDSTRDFLKNLDNIPFDEIIEARYFACREAIEGTTAYFQKVKTKKTAAKGARDIITAFSKAVLAVAPSAFTNGFNAFVKALSDKGVELKLLTRIPEKQFAAVFGGITSETVKPVREVSQAYGGPDNIGYLRVIKHEGLTPRSTIIVTGSALGVRNAMNIGATAVTIPYSHVAYQDFTGANATIKEFSAKTAQKVLALLRVE